MSPKHPRPRPPWAVRLQQERRRKLWSQRDLAKQLYEAADEGTRTQLAERESIMRRIRDWEAGKHFPKDPYPQLYCRVFGLTEEELFTPLPDLQGAPQVAPLPSLTAAHFAEILDHLRDQWHLLVQRDNLLGPRHAIAAVENQIAILSEMLGPARSRDRARVLALAAQYAESAAWLHEDGGDLAGARRWTDQATAWASEIGDHLMLAWAMFRRSQLAIADGHAGNAIGLATAAQSVPAELPTPMRAAILQQEAQGHALDGEEQHCQGLLDRAQEWAASVHDAGDARAGHGSFCTPAYIEVQRAHCWRRLRQPQRAVAAYESALPALPPVYRRDRGMALAGLAQAYAALREPERSATVASQALRVTQGTGSIRIMNVIQSVGRSLAPHRSLPAVADLRTELSKS